MRLRTDDQLVALFRMGNEDAFRVIYDRYRQRMFAYTRQMLAGSRSDAEDALQDVFLRAYGALRADDRPVTLRAWLYRVAHNRCIDQLRRPVPAPVDLFDVSRSPLHDPMLETERREDLRRLVADVRRLPEQQRSALLMREMEGLTYAELADALNVSIPAIKSLLVRARIGLVEAVEARDTACRDIRGDLASAHDRGVRVSGMARRHLRECGGCREYRGQLRAVQQGLGALSPSPHPLAALAKLLGIGGAGSGAAAGGGAMVGGGAAAATATKVAALVCCAAVVSTGAVEVRKQMGPTSPTAEQGDAAKAAGTASARNIVPAPDRTLDPAAAAATASPVAARPVGEAAVDDPAADAGPLDISVDDPSGRTIVLLDPSPTAVGKDDPKATGGMVAPDEEADGADAPAAQDDAPAGDGAPTDPAKNVAGEPVKAPGSKESDPATGSSKPSPSSSGTTAASASSQGPGSSSPTGAPEASAAGAS